MIELTTSDVADILKRHPTNLTARRWVNDPIALQVLLDHHLSWNEDHIKLNEFYMVFPLEKNVLYAMDAPEVTNQYIADKKEPPE